MTFNHHLSLARSAVLVGLLSPATPSYSLPQHTPLFHQSISTRYQQRQEQVERLANYIAVKKPNFSAHYSCQPKEPPPEACLAQFIIPPQRYAVMLTWEKDKQSYQGLGIYSFRNLLFPEPGDQLGIFDFLSGDLSRTAINRKTTRTTTYGLTIDRTTANESTRFDQVLEKILRSYW